MEEKGLRVGKARRKTVRDIQAPFDKNFNKYIAEIVTNSDDSYKRLEEKGIIDSNLTKSINIEISKYRKKEGYLVTITDQAEGLSIEKIREIFLQYGGDNSGGSDVKSRGIFGQGASDVLFNSAYNGFPSLIESIKDGVPSKTKFYLDDNLERFISPESIAISNNRLNQLRSSWKINENGTRITFGVNKDVFGGQISKIISSLENFYTFRYIFSASNRHISFRYEDKKEVELDSRKYLFKQENIILDDYQFSFKHEDFNVNARLNLYKKEDNNVSDDTKIIVRDNNYVVYANDFFKFDNNPKAKNIIGELILDNVYKISKYYLNTEEQASAVLTDTRDGFDVKHPFYKDLLKTISPIILETIEKYSKDSNEKDLTNNKKFSDALRDINKYLRKEIEEEISGGSVSGLEPPPEGIRFVRPEISININKKYNIKLLINTKKISHNQVIKVKNSSPDIEINPTEVAYDLNEPIDNLVVKNISITAKNITQESILISAETLEIKTELLVNVIDKEIYYPENGLEFHSSAMRVKYNTFHTASLYIDTKIIPINSIITITNNNKDIIVYDSSINLNEEDLVSNDIAIKNIQYSTSNNLGDFNIQANVKDFSATLVIQVREFDDVESGTSGLINGFKIRPDKDEFYQSYYDQSDKYIYILEENIINKTLMPNLSNIDKDKMNYSLADRKIIAEILSSEISTLLINQMIEKGKISIEINGQDSYLTEIKKRKAEIFKILLNSLDK